MIDELASATENEFVIAEPPLRRLLKRIPLRWWIWSGAIAFIALALLTYLSLLQDWRERVERYASQRNEIVVKLHRCVEEGGLQLQRVEGELNFDHRLTQYPLADSPGSFYVLLNCEGMDPDLKAWSVKLTYMGGLITSQVVPPPPEIALAPPAGWEIVDEIRRVIAVAGVILFAIGASAALYFKRREFAHIALLGAAAACCARGINYQYPWNGPYLRGHSPESIAWMLLWLAMIPVSLFVFAIVRSKKPGIG